MNRVTEISIAREFSAFPGGRDRGDGPFNGARFRDEVLKPLLKEYDEITLNLDGLAGLPSSFWEEIFGGVIRHHLISIDGLSQRLKLRTSEPELRVYIPLAYKYAQEAANAQAR